MCADGSSSFSLKAPIATEGRSMTAIEFNGVSFGWGNSTVLRDLSFSVDEGEVFALLGPSGCGKTTTLRLISGLLTPTKGSVAVWGKPAASYAGQERCVATVWQSRALFPHMSVRANIEFGLRVKRVNAAERKHRVDGVVRSLRLEELLDRDIQRLSGGEQQRVALARSLVIRPRVLLLDEPFTGLDQNLKLQLQGDLRDLRASHGYTYVMVSHSLEDVFSLADRLAVIKDGDIIQLDAPNSIYQNPMTPFVAQFVGDRNLIPGTVAGLIPDRNFASVMIGIDPPWIGINRDSVRINDKVFYVISPEDIKLDYSGDIRVEAMFRAKEIAGRREQYYLRLPNGHEIRAITYSHSGQAGHRFSPGQMVEISWKTSQALILKQE